MMKLEAIQRGKELEEKGPYVSSQHPSLHEE
jgi:hypothetical protein